jgi:hypothetical protein
MLVLSLLNEQPRGGNISAVPKQQGTILFSENGSVYPKTV